MNGFSRQPEIDLQSPTITSRQQECRIEMEAVIEPELGFSRPDDVYGAYPYSVSHPSQGAEIRQVNKVLPEQR